MPNLRIRYLSNNYAFRIQTLQPCIDTGPETWRLGVRAEGQLIGKWET